MGPEPNDGQVEVAVGPIARIQHGVVSTVKKYFSDPLYHLFYIGLFAALVGTFFGVRLPPEFWVLLSALAGVRLFIFITSYKNTHGEPE